MLHVGRSGAIVRAAPLLYGGDWSTMVGGVFDRMGGGGDGAP